MKKLDLKKFAMMGIIAGVAATSSVNASDLNLNQQLADQYICANYNNCGLCGGKCNLKNPDTPGLTPEQKKQAEEYQAKHKDDKKDNSDDSNASGGCGGTFCGAQTENATSSDSKNSEKMRAKRTFKR